MAGTMIGIGNPDVNNVDKNSCLVRVVGSLDRIIHYRWAAEKWPDRNSI